MISVMVSQDSFSREFSEAPRWHSGLQDSDHLLGAPSSPLSLLETTARERVVGRAGVSP